MLLQIKNIPEDRNTCSILAKGSSFFIIKGTHSVQRKKFYFILCSHTYTGFLQ